MKIKVVIDNPDMGQIESVIAGDDPKGYTKNMDREKLDEVLGITRCARCGHRLEGEIECPFCSMFPDFPLSSRVPVWVYFTACFLTSPLSLYFIITTRRLSNPQKVLAASGALLWGIYIAL